MKRRKRASQPSGLRGADLSADLLAWYDRHRRKLPWRALPGERSDPYRVWLSEIMLQQTTIKAVVPYFARFAARWPSVRALAAAPLEDVLKLWAGLGYYARARHLHACAKAVVERHGGHFPQSQVALAALPGIGPYTAAAIAAIAFDAPAAAVDGNVERVVARLYALEAELPQPRPRFGGSPSASCRLNAPVISRKQLWTSARPSARRRSRPARCAHGWARAPRVAAAIPRRFRSKRRRKKDGCAAARRSWSFAATASCSCARAHRRDCSAA